MADVPPLVTAAMKKTGVVWVAPDGPDTAVPAWLHWTGAAAYVVCGPGEQPLPGLADAESAVVTVRSSDTLGRIVAWVARVEPVAPGTSEWDEVVPALVLGRLNAPDGAALADRWARTAAVRKLSPTGELVEPSTGSQAAPPRATSATTA